MITESIDLLLVESDTAEADRMESILGSLPDLPLTVHRVADPAGAAEHLKDHRPSLLILCLDTARPGANKTLGEFRSRYSWLPILLVATDHDPKAAMALVRQGAQDCLGQDELLPDLLARSIRHAVARHAAEAALRANEDLMRLVAENTTDLIAVLDRDGRRLFNSPSYTRTFGESVDLFGTDSFAEIHPEDRESVRQLFNNTLKTGQGHRAEFRFQLPGGAVRWLESVGSVIRDARGEPDRVVVVSRDLTEKHKLVEGFDRTVAQLRKLQVELTHTRRRLQQAEKSEASSTFAPATAHEIKNAAQTLLLGLDFLKALLPTEDEGINRVLREMAAAARKTDHAMAGWLALTSDGPPPTPSRQNLTDLVQHCVEAVRPDAQAKGLRLEYQTASRAHVIFTEPVRLRHVLLRLLVDSIRRTPEQGLVRLSTQTRRSSLAGALEPPTGSQLVLIELADERPHPHEDPAAPLASGSETETAEPDSSLDETTLRRVVEELGGSVEVTWGETSGRRLTLLFTLTGETDPQESTDETR